jgi:acyl dehydratase
VSIFDNTVQPGHELPDVACQFQLSNFKRGDAQNIHTDEEAAKREGLPAPVATGPQVAALIFRQLRSAFGEGWIVGGKCALDFRRPVYVTDFCVARGKVTGREMEGDKLRLLCDVWIQNQNDEKVIAGVASGLVDA